jgi:hypothetical protein
MYSLDTPENKRKEKNKKTFQRKEIRKAGKRDVR